ncbi:YciI family protein [Oceanicaulis sp.]|uniref:YciI family protein n=1 Tax=Oceanicaulis sp. TaxID=1924941 RepID=UPI003D2CE926
MQFALLIYETADDFTRRRGPDAAAYWSSWAAYSGALKAHTTGGACLKSPETGVVLSQTQSGRQVQDGPYAETKEQLGGVILFEADTLDEALAWADRCPAAQNGAVEVRPVQPMSEIAEMSS